MASVEVGGRVGAIESETATEVRLYGYGVYNGRQEHPLLGFPNPKITLDDGQVVWGLECWWGAEAQIRKRCEGKTVVLVPTPSMVEQEAN